MKNMNLKWSRSNTKLKKTGIVAFGIPALKSKSGFVTCPNAGFCAKICYARQGAYNFPVVQNAKEHNLEVIRKYPYSWALAAIQDLKRIKAKTVRIHDAGDFFNQIYLDGWVKIARTFPEKTFYAYTKMVNLDYSNLPVNFKIIQSDGGRLDHLIDKSKPHARIFKTLSDLVDAGYSDGSQTDELAISGAVMIGLVYHGSTPLNRVTEQLIK